jgi:predicted transglutaminase-like cysteine proteinase
MRKELLRTIAAASFAALTSAGLLALAAPASAQPSAAREMSLGGVAAAPPGYLDFCVRTPAQCGLAGLTDADGQPLSPEALRRKLFNQFYWASAFGFATPAAGGDIGAGRERAQASTRRTDWNAIFGAVRVASAQPTPAPSHNQAAEDPIKSATGAAASSDAALAQLPLSASMSTQFFAALDKDWLAKAGATDALGGTAPSYDRVVFSVALSRSLARPLSAVASAEAPAQTQVADAGASAPRPDAQADRAAWAAEAPAYAVQASPSSPQALAQAAAYRAAAEAAGTPAYAAQGQLAAAPQTVQPAAFDRTGASQPGMNDEPAYAQGPTTLQMSRDLMAELDRVNQSVNREIRYVSDKVLYGNEDYWHLSLDPGGPRAGDCKDYVLEKRRALINDGIPAAALSIAIVQTPWRETHAILLVKTDQGELVLDSLSSWVQPWWKVNYHWIERQAPGQQLTWISIS